MGVLIKNGCLDKKFMSSPLAGGQSSPKNVSDWLIAIPDGGGVDLDFAEQKFINSIYTWDVNTNTTRHYIRSSISLSWSCSSDQLNVSC